MHVWSHACPVVGHHDREVIVSPSWYVAVVGRLVHDQMAAPRDRYVTRVHLVRRCCRSRRRPAWT